MILTDKAWFDIAKIQSSDAEEYDEFGGSVSIYGDYIVVGAEDEDTNSSNAGSVYIFKRDTNNSVSQIAKIQSSDAEEYDHFGGSVSIYGDYIVVGAENEDTNGSNAGSVYIFKIDTNDSVSQITKIQSSDAEEYDHFGGSVSINGDYIVVGAYGKDTNSSNAGNAYIFKIDTNDSVSQIAKIQASDAEAYDYFGNSVSINGDYIVVGAKDEDTNGSSAGSAYIFKIDTNDSVSQIAKIQASDAKDNDRFGWSVGIDGDYIVVGAKYEDTNGDDAGSAYIFKIDTNDSVSQIAKIQASDAEESDKFGGSVSIYENYIVVGAEDEDTSGPSAGSAYIFKRDLNQAIE